MRANWVYTRLSSSSTETSLLKFSPPPQKGGKKEKKKHQQIRSISDGFTACTRFNARQLSFANVEGAET